MKLLVVGCNFRKTPVQLRERLAFRDEQVPRALEELNRLHDCEAVILSTCNRVELYVAHARQAIEPAAIGAFLASFHGIAMQDVQPSLYAKTDVDAVRHLFRVVASLESMIVGEGQIAGQVKTAYEVAQRQAAVGPVLHALFQGARRVAGRVRTETRIGAGHASVSSAAVDYVRQVFEHFGDKTVLVIGAGKMSELTLRQLQGLQPREVFITNRSREKAEALATGCRGKALGWEELDEALARADIVLSSTGSTEPIVTRERFARIDARRGSSPLVILDIAVPRDFEPEIHDGDRTFLFNIDDLMRIRQSTLEERLKHVGPAEAIVEQEVRRFVDDWKRRRHGTVIAHLTQEMEAKRQAITAQLFARLNGRLTEAERTYIEGAFRLLQNQFLHGPISALAREPHEGGKHTLLEALRKLFGLQD